MILGSVRDRIGLVVLFALVAAFPVVEYYNRKEGLDFSAKKRFDPPPRPVVRPGNIVPTKFAAFCMDTETGFDEVTKWSVRGDREEIARAIVKHGGQIVKAGQSIKILDIGIMRARVRVLDSGERECWVPTEAVR